MGKLTPFILLAVAIGVGVAFAPLIGWLTVLACLVGLVWFAFLVVRASPTLSALFWCAVLAGLVWLSIAEYNTRIGTAAGLFVGVVALGGLWEVIRALTRLIGHRWAERTARE